jgi:eukaryotic-like serine/threonine-protein kinase
VTTLQDELSVALADRYRIERELGAGGMATVYLARDLKHDRDVAVKVLHPDLGAALGSERFLAEIRTTARLQHPHILPLLDSGEAGGFLFYVMPFVAGETLRSKLERERQLPIDETVSIAREVADALGAAHAVGIVHRDIKPENILLQSGHALVADFGIALAVQQAGAGRMTQTGLSLGTPQYMSPEQAMGERTIDARSDIYALGAVTYEMLTGEPPFTGPTVQAIIAKAMAERPVPPSTVRDTVPPAVERAVLRALAKLPADRFATAPDFAVALSSSTTAYETGAVRPRTRSTSRERLRDPLVVGLATAVVALASILIVAASRHGTTDADPFPFRTLIGGADTPTGSVALSPDGQSVVFAGRSAIRERTVVLASILYSRRLDQLTSRPIPGTEGAGSTVFSPDGKWIAFVAKRAKIVKLPLDGGSPIPLGNVAADGGLDWSKSGDIVAGSGLSEGRTGLLRLNSAGAFVPFTQVDTARNELSHQFPHVLADGKTVLFTIWHGSLDASELAATSLADGKVVHLGLAGAEALGVVAGRLVFVNADGVAMAVPFDAARLQVHGSAVAVQDSIEVTTESGVANAAVNTAGGFVFARSAPKRRLLWVDAAGTTRPAFSETRDFVSPRLSPDGRRAAIQIRSGPKMGIWILDVAAGTLVQLATPNLVRNPVWSPDGRRLLYVATPAGHSAFWWQPADGTGPAIKAADAPHNPWHIDLSPDGHTTVFNAIYKNGTFNVETFSLDSSHAERDIAATPAVEVFGQFSPDGREVAYSSDESGKSEVYVRPSSGAGGPVQVSVGGAVRPVWSRDGRRIFYWQQDTLMAAAVAREPAFHVVSREALFAGNFDREFDVAPDGKRFLMIQEESAGVDVVAVPNWLTELRRLTTPGKTTANP